MNIDQYGLIVCRQSDGSNDGGDSLQRAGYWAVGCRYSNIEIHGAYFSMIDALALNGKLIRHPVMWNDPHDISRDQMIPNLCTGLTKCPSVLFPNGDICWPQHYGLYIRAKNMWGLWPLLWLSDIGLVIDCLFGMIKGLINPSYTDDAINNPVMLEQAKRVLPTPVSWFARKIYYKFRRMPVCDAIRFYFKGSGNEDLGEMWCRVIND